MGIIDGLLGGNGPSLNIVPLDAGTTKIIGDQTTRAGQSDASLGAQDNAGVKAAGQLPMQTDQQIGQQAAGTGQNASMLQAIRNQYSNQAGKGIQNIVNQNQNQVGMQRAQMMQQASQAALAQQQVETTNFSMLSQAMNQADAARSQILSGILGVGGMAAGMAMGRARAPRQRSPESTSMGGQGTGNNLNAFNEE